MNVNPLRMAAQFATSGPAVASRPYGSGHVNTTFLVTDTQGARYVLQRINGRAFHRPDQVMSNIVRITTAMSAQTSDRRRLSLVPVHGGGWWVRDESGQVWRMYDFIDGSMELSSPVTAAEFAGSVIATLPVIILFALIEGKVVSGLTAGSIK